MPLRAMEKGDKKGDQFLSGDAIKREAAVAGRYPAVFIAGHSSSPKTEKARASSLSLLWAKAGMHASTTPSGESSSFFIFVLRSS